MSLTIHSSRSRFAARLNSGVRASKKEVFMSNGKMDRRYFEEKKELTLEGIQQAQDTAGEVIGLLSSWSYEVPNIFNATEVHDYIRAAKAQLDGVRRNFEKVRWASTNTDIEFDEWLIKNGHSDLVL